MKGGKEDGAAAWPALRIPLWLVWIVALGFIFIGQGSAGILDNNEGLYSEIPREMLAAGDWRDWVIPHLNGLPYMEKPPLLYWLTALSFFLFGEHEWSARLVPALSALSCVALLLWFGTAVGRRQAGRLAALMFVSGAGVTAMSRVLMFDMLLTALLTAALMFAFRYTGEGRPRLLRWSYAFLALAVMAKGFVALVLFGLVVAGMEVFVRRPPLAFLRALGKWFEPGALLVFLAVAAPWHLAASLTEPVFSWFYFINEHVLRFLGRREPHDYYAGPWWYYLPRMAIYLFPWSFLAPLVLRRRGGARPGEGEQSGLRRFLWLAWLAPLCFFSISSAKANYYLIAVMPFAALHLACAIEDRDWSRAWQRALPGLLIAALALLLCIGVALRAAESIAGPQVAGLAPQRFLLAACGGLALLALLTALATRRRSGNWMLAYLALPVWLGGALVLVLLAMGPQVSTREVAAYLRHELPDRKVYLYRQFEQKSSLPFYLKQPVPVVDSQSNDLYWGMRLRRNGIAISTEQFGALAKANAVAIVVPDRQLAAFLAAGLDQALPHRRHIGDVTVFAN